MRKNKKWQVTYDVFKLEGDVEVFDTSVAAAVEAMNSESAINKALKKEKRIHKNAKAVLVVIVES